MSNYFSLPSFLVLIGITCALIVRIRLVVCESYLTQYASGDKRHYETTLERVRDYYGLVMDTERFKEAIGKLDKIRKGEIDVRTMPEEQVEAFLEEFNLLDPRKFAPEETVL